MVFIREMDMPYGIRANCIEDHNGDYNIYLNSRYCDDQKRKSLEHELRHILNGDFQKEITASEIERNM